MTSRFNHLPRLRLSKTEFEKLLEYSATNPTGVYPGKRWRRLDGAHDQEFKRTGGKPEWIICEYQAIPGDDKHVKNVYYKPIIVCRSRPRG